MEWRQEAVDHRRRQGRAFAISSEHAGQATDVLGSDDCDPIRTSTTAQLNEIQFLVDSLACQATRKEFFATRWAAPISTKYFSLAEQRAT